MLVMATVLVTPGFPECRRSPPTRFRRASRRAEHPSPHPISILAYLECPQEVQPEECTLDSCSWILLGAGSYGASPLRMCAPRQQHPSTGAEGWLRTPGTPSDQFGRSWLRILIYYLAKNPAPSAPRLSPFRHEARNKARNRNMEIRLVRGAPATAAAKQSVSSLEEESEQHL